MKRVFFCLLLFCAALSAQVPTCNLTLTATGASTTAWYNNQTSLCRSFTVTYHASGFSALSFEIDGAPCGSTCLTQGTPVAIGSPLQGSNPSTDTGEATIVTNLYYPWIRLNLASKTGTGTFSSTAFGYPALSARTSTINANPFAPYMTPCTDQAGDCFVQISGDGIPLNGQLLITTPLACPGCPNSGANKFYIDVGDLYTFMQFTGQQLKMTDYTGVDAFEVGHSGVTVRTAADIGCRALGFNTKFCDETVTNGGYTLYVSDSGTLGTARFSNNTPTTGATRVVVGLGAADSASTVIFTSEGTIKSAGYQSSDGSAGISRTVTVKGSDGNNCNTVYKNGLLVSSTCP